MKVKFFLFFMFLAFANESVAQILVGPTIGGNFSWSSFGDKDYKDLYKVKPVFGYHAGMNLSFRVRKRFFLHSSFIYSTKGKVLEGKEDPLLRNKVTYNYIELPILYTVEFKGAVKGGREFKWYFGAGPNISYWLGGKGTIYSSDISETHFAVDEIKYRIVFDRNIDELGDNRMNAEDPNRLQLGLNVSAGLVFEPLRDQKFMLTLRYEIGHSYLSKDGAGVFPIANDYTEVLQTRNQGFRLSLAYLVDLKVEERKKGKSTIKKSRL